jgi:hypothetical protein
VRFLIGSHVQDAERDLTGRGAFERPAGSGVHAVAGAIVKRHRAPWRAQPAFDKSARPVLYLDENDRV